MSTYLSTISEMNLDEPNKVDTGITLVESESQPQIEPKQGEEQTVDHSALKSAIQAIMSDSQSSPHTDNLRKDRGHSSGGGQVRTYEQFKESQMRAQYYNQAFAVREQPNETRDRLMKTSILTAEIKTNVIVSISQLQSVYLLILLRSKMNTHFSRRCLHSLQLVITDRNFRF